MTRFWDWAIAAYARPGAAEACLQLQDDHAQSVPFLLWAAWAAQDGRVLSPATLALGAAVAAAWDEAAVHPLRQVRRGLKAHLLGLPDAAREAVRQQVKAVELAAERALIEALDAMTVPTGPAPMPLAESLATAGAAWSPPVSAEALTPLVQILAS